MPAVLLGLVFLAGCGGAPPPPSNGAPPIDVEAGPSWARDLFPARVEGDVRLDRYGEHNAVVYGGRVYGSNGDDMPSQVMLALYPALLRDDGLADRPVALIGIGCGVELAVLLRLGARVDLYEPDPRLLENAEAIGSELGLVFVRLDAHRFPEHPRLRIIRSLAEAPAEPVRYDAIVHANAGTVTSRPPVLYQVERFERLLRLLAPDGVLAIHLQLYEIADTMHRRLLATFAAAAPNVVVFAPESYSSDSYLYASPGPLRLSLASIDRVFGDPQLAALREKGQWTRRLDPAVRALFRDRTEVLLYSQGASRFTEAAPLAMDEWPVRPPVPPPPGPGDDENEWDAWDNHHRLWMEQSGFDDEFSTRFYEEGWQPGDPCDGAGCVLLGPVVPADLVDLARSHLAHAQIARAESRVAAAEQAGAGEPAVVVRSLVRMLTTEPLPPVPPLIVLGVGPSAPGAAAVASAWARAEGGQGTFEEVLDALLDVADEYPGATSALRGIAYVRMGESDLAHPLLEDAIEAGGVLEKYPAARFYFARALWDDLWPERAVDAMERYLARDQSPASSWR